MVIDFWAVHLGILLYQVKTGVINQILFHFLSCFDFFQISHEL